MIECPAGLCNAADKKCDDSPSGGAILCGSNINQIWACLECDPTNAGKACQAKTFGGGMVSGTCNNQYGCMSQTQEKAVSGALKENGRVSWGRPESCQTGCQAMLLGKWRCADCSQAAESKVGTKAISPRSGRERRCLQAQSCTQCQQAALGECSWNPIESQCAYWEATDLRIGLTDAEWDALIYSDGECPAIPDVCPGLDCVSCLDYVPEDEESYCGFSDAGCELASTMSMSNTGFVWSSSECPQVAESSLSMSTLAFQGVFVYVLALIGLVSIFMVCFKSFNKPTEYAEVREAEI